MARVRLRRPRAQELASREYSFTVLFEPLFGFKYVEPNRGRTGKRSRPRMRIKNPTWESGYQVIVPVLPGLITYGRTLAEAREMARDAIRCHLEGMRKAGEPIPDERKAHKEKLRIALTA